MTAKRSLLGFAVGAVLGAASLSYSSPACPRTQGFGVTVTSVKKDGAVISTNASPQGYSIRTSPDDRPTHVVADVLDPDANATRTLSLVKLQ